MLRTFALLISIIRSAIGVIAVLWVITITVVPVLRQVSCNNFKTDFQYRNQVPRLAHRIKAVSVL